MNTSLFPVTDPPPTPCWVRRLWQIELCGNRRCSGRYRAHHSPSDLVTAHFPHRAVEDDAVTTFWV